MAKAQVCFHKRRRCGFCGIPRPALAKARRQCACCGRFMHKTRSEASCPVCVRWGYEAIELFPCPTPGEVERSVTAQRAMEEGLAAAGVAV